MKTHELKTWPEYFVEVFNGNKTFEIRKDDRGFEVGDILVLLEWSPKTESYTGAHCSRRITYITGYGQPDGQVVLGMLP